MKAESHKIVTPKPFFNISFGCSTRAFYNVKLDLHQIAENIGVEIQDGYITEICDYEGDLDKIIVYRGGREEVLAKAVLEFYEIQDSVPESMDIVLTIFPEN